MNFKTLQKQAKKIIDQRGGTDALKQDAQELQNIAKGKGTMSEKAKKAADALKEPGAPGSSQRPR
ncbi:MAG: hypothetical protein JHC84_13470 [Solirubrobacteraceae bacterium]|nr:hypothetical protein [Solirubrobacteraceae bacterium]